MSIAAGRENIHFDGFDESAKLSHKFKKTLRKDLDVENSFLVLLCLVF